MNVDFFRRPQERGFFKGTFFSNRELLVFKDFFVKILEEIIFFRKNFQSPYRGRGFLKDFFDDVDFLKDFFGTPRGRRFFKGFFRTPGGRGFFKGFLQSSRGRGFFRSPRGHAFVKGFYFEVSVDVD